MAPSRCAGLVAAMGILVGGQSGAALGNPAAPGRLHRGFLLTVTGSVGPVDGLTFVIDTGASRTIIDVAVAQALRLDGPPEPLFGFDAQFDARRVVLPSLQISDWRLHRPTVLSTTLAGLASRFGTRVDGIIGLDFLERRCLAIDYLARTFRLDCANPPRLNASAALGGPPYLTVRAIIDDVTVSLAVDTGADALALFDRSMRLEWRRRTASATRAASHLSGTSRVGRFTANTVRIGSTESARRDIYVIYDTVPELEYEGVLGTRTLGGYVEIDVCRRVLRWD